MAFREFRAVARNTSFYLFAALPPWSISIPRPPETVKVRPYFFQTRAVSRYQDVTVAKRSEGFETRVPVKPFSSAGIG